MSLCVCPYKMQELCPLCLKNGVKKKVKLLQINLQEAVWVCEDEKCVWPFGYEDFILHLRPVGKIWSCFWDDYKSVASNAKDTITTFLKPSLSGTSVASSENILDKVLAETHTHFSNNVNNSFDSLNTSEENSELENHMGTNILLSTKTRNISNRDNNVNNNSLESVRSNIEDATVENAKVENFTRGIPKITSIERTNIDISTLKIESQTYQDPGKNNIHFDKDVNIKAEGLSSPELFAQDKVILKPELSITKVEINGLPPITLSFEIPPSVTKSETVISNMQSPDAKANIKPNAPQTKNRIARTILNSGRQYEKFNFNAIKKKIETDNAIKTSNNGLKDSIDKNSGETINNASTANLSSNHKDKICNINSSTSTVSHLNTCATNLPNEQDISPQTAEINTSINLDSVMDDLLNNKLPYISDNLNDEWIQSLLA